VEHESITGAAALFASYLVVTGGTYKLFEKTDDIVSREAKEKAAEWLRGGKGEAVTIRISRLFSNAFDSVFGSEFPPDTYAKSCLASLVCILLSLCVWASLRPTEFLAWIHGSVPLRDLAATLALGGGLNFIPDYLSLIKTRAFITLLSRKAGFLSGVAILAADACVSVGLGLLAFMLLSALEFASGSMNSEMLLAVLSVTGVCWIIAMLAAALSFGQSTLLKTQWFRFHLQLYMLAAVLPLILVGDVFQLLGVFDWHTAGERLVKWFGHSIRNNIVGHERAFLGRSWGDKFWSVFWNTVWESVVSLRAPTPETLPRGLWFYATFFTSFWLWLSALAAIILRLGQAVSATRKFFNWFVKIDEKPFKAIGLAALGVETMVFLVLALIMGVRSVMA
jgi:hypothetical protein